MAIPRDSRVYTTRLDSETTDIDVTPITGAHRHPLHQPTRAAVKPLPPRNGNYQFDNLAQHEP